MTSKLCEFFVKWSVQPVDFKLWYLYWLEEVYNESHTLQPRRQPLIAPSAAEAMALVFQMTADERKVARGWMEKDREINEESPSAVTQIEPSNQYLNRASIPASTAFLCASATLQEEGKTLLRVGEVLSLLEGVGRVVSNPAQIAQNLSREVPPLVTIVSKSLGRAGIGYVLTSAGLEKARLVYEKENSTASTSKSNSSEK